MVNFLSVQTHFLSRSFLSRTLASTALFCSMTVSATAKAIELDWQPREQLTHTQQATLNQYCRGAYIDGWQAIQVQPSTHADAIQLFANAIKQGSEGDIQLQGEAEMRSSQFSLQADRIQTNASGYYSAQGDIRLRQASQLIHGSEVVLNDEKITIEQAQFLFHDKGIRGSASQIESTKGVIFIEEGFYTTCEPNNGSWQLYGSSIKLDSVSGFGTAKHVQIRIHGYPIFYFPWLRFPINDQRHSGFLFPSFGYSSSDGFNVSTPYYLNLGPNYDATITPHFVEKQGEGVDLEVRHLSRFGTTIFEQASFSDQEEGLQITRKLQTQQQFSQAFRAGLLLEDNPTEELYPEKNSTSLGEQDHYERSAYLQYDKGNFSANVTNKRYQTPDADEEQPFDWLPRFSASYYYSSPIFTYQPEAQYTDFFIPDSSKTDGIRQVINQTFSLNATSSWGFFNPGLLSQYRAYDFNDKTTEELHHTSHFLDSGLILERRFTGSNWRQTLEPKLSYLNSPFRSQNAIPDFDTSEKELTYEQAFSHTRFSGNDRIGDTEQYTLALESRIYDANNIERWTLKLGQVFYLQDRRISVTGNNDSDIETEQESPLLASISYQENEPFSAALDLNYNTEKEALELGRFSARYAQKNGVLLMANYLYQVDSDNFMIDTKQSQLATIFPLTDNLHFFYQQDYDWLNDQDIKSVTGFGFENCCVKASASYQRWLDSDDDRQDGFFLRFILRSLSSAGTQNTINSVENDYWNEGNIGYN
ncbi:LPS-assembly protein LptD [Marinomonas agarivorans]|nr:LPS-assembly protein LptD [Marinomonas agarivorans]